MLKTGVRAPRKPRGESLKVTIGNQEKQIKLLIDRCESLNNMLSASNRRVDEVKEELSVEQSNRVSADIKIELMADSYNRLLGWQDCAREVMGVPK